MPHVQAWAISPHPTIAHAWCDRGHAPATRSRRKVLQGIGLLAILDRHQLSGHVPMNKFPAFGASLFKPNSIGPFTDALFDLAHRAYRVAYSTLAGIFATDINGCATWSSS